MNPVHMTSQCAVCRRCALTNLAYRPPKLLYIRTFCCLCTELYRCVLFSLRSCGCRIMILRCCASSHDCLCGLHTYFHRGNNLRLVCIRTATRPPPVPHTCGARQSQRPPRPKDAAQKMNNLGRSRSRRNIPARGRGCCRLGWKTLRELVRSPTIVVPTAVAKKIGRKKYRARSFIFFNEHVK